MKSYFIKNGYALNLKDDGTRVFQYTDVPKDVIFQVECYKYAASVIKENNLESCLELGSGAGFKLNRYIRPVCDDLYGLDLPHATAYCEKLYKDIKWISDDFDYNQPAINKKFDLIISFDVIEHLIYPENLLDKIKSYSHANTRILISTPERDLVRGKDHFGPAPNEKHVREWNQDELARFLEFEGLHINKHLILEAKKLSLRLKFATWRRGIITKTCQLVDCTLSNTGHSNSTNLQTEATD